MPMNEQGLHRREYHRPPPWPFSQPIIGAGRIMRPPPPPVHHCYCYSMTKILQGSTPAATDEQLSTRTRPNRTKLNLGRHIGMWNETNEPPLLTDEPLCARACVRVCVCDGDASGDLTRPKLGGVSADQGIKKRSAPRSGLRRSEKVAAQLTCVNPQLGKGTKKHRPAAVALARTQPVIEPPPSHQPPPPC